MLVYFHFLQVVTEDQLSFLYGNAKGIAVGLRSFVGLLISVVSYSSIK